MKRAWLASVAIVAACSEPSYEEEYPDPVVQDDHVIVPEDSDGSRS